MTSDVEPRGGWACFPDDVPPREIFEGLRQLIGLPPGARQNLWQLLWLALRSPKDPDAQNAVQTFANRFEANAANVLGAVRASDYLLRQAAAFDVPADAFRRDLERLSQGDADSGAVELLMSQYAQAHEFLRGQLLESTLADHGNVLTAIDWRIDQVRLSNHGHAFAADVVFLNLKYRMQDREAQLSLQLTPGAVAALRALFDQFEPRAAKAADR